ncbi:MAG: helix-turn-helix transcriptional regulator, partial [Dongiaceae bacterium]
MTTSDGISAKGWAEDYAKGAQIEPHSHVSHQIVHAATGVMRIASRGGTWVVPPGRALWMPAGVLHSIACVGAVAMRTVYLRGEHPAFPADCTVWSVSPLMRELILRMVGQPDPVLVPPLLSLLIAEIENVESVPLHIPEPSDPRLRRVTAALLAEPTLERPIASLAKDAAMSTRTFIRRFHLETGMTLRQWRRQARLLLALERLGAGASVSDAAFDVGYSSASAFVHAFRGSLGTTPGRYFPRSPRLNRGRS